MKIAVAGTGYVGLSIATLLAQHNEVVAVDIVPEKVDKINKRIPPIQDEYIERYSEKWDFDRISRTALAIMKTAMYEVLYMPDVPNGVSINEAVELAKKYEEPEVVPFVNGILGAFVKGETV